MLKRSFCEGSPRGLETNPRVPVRVDPVTVVMTRGVPDVPSDSWTGQSRKRKRTGSLGFDRTDLKGRGLFETVSEVFLVLDLMTPLVSCDDYN